MKEKIINYLKGFNYPADIIEDVRTSSFSTFILEEIWMLLKKKDLADYEIKWIFASENQCKVALSRYNRNKGIDDLVFGYPFYG